MVGIQSSLIEGGTLKSESNDLYGSVPYTTYDYYDDTTKAEFVFLSPDTYAVELNFRLQASFPNILSDCLPLVTPILVSLKSIDEPSPTPTITKAVALPTTEATFTPITWTIDSLIPEMPPSTVSLKITNPHWKIIKQPKGYYDYATYTDFCRLDLIDAMVDFKDFPKKSIGKLQYFFMEGNYKMYEIDNLGDTYPWVANAYNPVSVNMSSFARYIPV